MFFDSSHITLSDNGSFFLKYIQVKFQNKTIIVSASLYQHRHSIR